MEKPTKRHVLSLVAQIYYPCGFLAPCTMTAKCFMQLLWTTGLQWDEPLTSKLNATWNNFTSSLPALAKLKIPQALQFASNSNIELHGFSYASEQGYAAVVYVQCSQPNGEVIIPQVLAKLESPPSRE